MRSSLIQEAFEPILRAGCIKIDVLRILIGMFGFRLGGTTFLITWDVGYVIAFDQHILLSAGIRSVYGQRNKRGLR